jgi:hypothetical protein
VKFTLAVVLGVTCALAQTPQAPPAPGQVPAPPTVNLDSFKVNDELKVGAYYWLTSGFTDLNPGRKAANPAAQTLKLPNPGRQSKGIVIETPAGKYNSIQIEVFQATGGSALYAPQALSLFGTTLPKGDFLATNMKLRGGKISWNYLTYPSPPESSWFRLKTLWEMHVLQIQGIADDVTAAVYGVPTTATGTKTLVLPAVGLGFEIAPSKHYHVEWKTSGMALPHKSRIIDSEASVAIRVKHAEALIGAKLLDYRTSPNADQFFKGRLFGPFGGLRWVF